jgi:hypothetical protein
MLQQAYGNVKRFFEFFLKKMQFFAALRESPSGPQLPGQ